MVHLSNLSIVCRNIDNYTTERADLDYNGCSVSIDNVFRRVSISGDIGHCREYGILVAHNGSMLTDFNNYSAQNSGKSFLVSQGGVGRLENMKVTKKLTLAGGTWYPVVSLIASGYETWLDPDGTYYYQAQVLADPSRKIGKTASSENSLALTYGGNGALISLLSGGTAYSLRNLTLRLYRGTSSGSYGKYVDLPAIYTSYIYDDGNCPAGFKWKSRAAGAADSVNTFDIQELNSLNAIVKANYPPVYGTWLKNDQVLTINPGPGDPPGWVCTSSGTFSSATDSTGDTDGSSQTITDIGDTSDFAVDEWISISAGFPTTGPYRITFKTASTITVNANSTKDSSNNLLQKLLKKF